jgi:hypothetical protein
MVRVKPIHPFAEIKMHVENAYQSVRSIEEIDHLLDSIREFLKKSYSSEELIYLRRMRQRAYDKKRFWKGPEVVNPARTYQVVKEENKPTPPVAPPAKEKKSESATTKRYSFTIDDKEGQTISYHFDNCSFTIEKKMNDELSLMLTGSVGSAGDRSMPAPF